MCFRKPRPEWRLFGRFVAKDTFVGLLLVDRITLGTNANYGQYIRNLQSMWASQGLPQPIRSNSLNDYLSGTVRDVDNPIF